MNRESSRSHAVFTITLESKKKVCVACKGGGGEGGREGGVSCRGEGREGCLVGRRGGRGVL